MALTVNDFDIHRHQSPLSELKKILQSNVFPNAFLFTGNAHSGKKQAALFFTKAANCLNNSVEPCDQCRSCKKINAALHPDVFQISCEEKKNISISQVRDITALISVKKNEAKIRVVIIDDAGKMNIPAQNALLKILEEPPQGTLFILNALRLIDLLPTVISRCRHIRFFPLMDDDVQQHLMTAHHIDSDMAYIAAKTCDGDLQKSLRFLNLDESTGHADWIQKRLWLLTELSNLLKQAYSSPVSMMKSLFVAEKIGSEPDALKDSFLVLQSFFRDIAVFPYHPEKIINRDFFDSFKDISQKYPYNRIIIWTRYLFEAEQKIDANTTIRSTLEHFFLKLCSEMEN